MKKTGIMAVVLLVFIFIVGYIVNQGDVGSLVKEKSAIKQVGDFILHMKVERANNGINIFKSLQYIGEEPIEIMHQTPLVSVSLNQKNHDYTGSLVSKRLEKGSIYPQEVEILNSNTKGECNLYVEANFLVEGEKISIEHVEELMFQ